MQLRSLSVDIPSPTSLQEQDARRIFEAADVDKNGSLSLMELQSYIHSNPKELAAVTIPGSSQWADLVELFQFDSKTLMGSCKGRLLEIDKNKDGQIQVDEWVEYYELCIKELQSRQE